MPTNPKTPIARRAATSPLFQTASLLCLVGGMFCAQAAHAQAGAPGSLVSVCSGVSLPRSVVTDIMRPVNIGLVAPIESSVNDILGVVRVIPIVGQTFAPLAIDVSGLLDDAAAGQPITLQVLNRGGTVVAPTDVCNVQGDSYALADEGGISIGGNRIAGLGQNGAAASAVDVDAIAFGNGAAAVTGATGSVALGHNASVSAANSVAVGQNAVASRGEQVGYGAYGLSAAQTSAGEFSVGAPGALRQITHVAAGSASTDAATVGQVQGAIDQVNALAANAVSYDSGAQQRISLNGAGGTVIGNLAGGAVNATSGEAVNGSQLYAVDQAVQVNAGALAALDGRVTGNGTAIGGLDTRLGAAEGDLLALDDRIFANEGTILSLDGRVAVNEGAIGDLGDRVTGNSAALLALDDRVLANGSAITANGGAIAALDDRLVSAEGTLSGLASDVAANGTAIAAVDTRIGAVESAVSGLDDRVTAQSGALAGLDSRLGSAETAIAANGAGIAANATGIAANGIAIAANGTAIAAQGAAIADNSARIDVNTGDIATLKAGAANGVRYDTDMAGNRLNRITLAGGDASAPVSIGNVADAALSATSREAVNGAQLHETNQNVQANSGAILSLDGRVGVNEGDIAGLKTQTAALGDDVTAINGRVTANRTDIAALEQRTNATDARVSAVDNRVTAINGRVTGNSDSITVLQRQVANNPIQYVSSTDPGLPSATPTDRATLVSPTDGAVTLGNIAAGRVAADSNEAVNGSQLAAMDNRVTQNRTTIANIASNLAGSTVIAVQYSAADDPTRSNGGTLSNHVTLVGADAAEPVQLHNVAAGTAGTDAVNVAQLAGSLQNLGALANDYTDRRIDALSFDLAETGKQSAAGIAGALAVAGLPQVMEPGKSMLAGGVGYHRGEAAFALGASSTINDGQAIVKLGASVDTRGYGSANAGLGIQF